MQQSTAGFSAIQFACMMSSALQSTVKRTRKMVWPDLSGSLRTLYILCRDWNFALASCRFCEGVRIHMHVLLQRELDFRAAWNHLVSGILVWGQLQSKLSEGLLNLSLHEQKELVSSCTCAACAEAMLKYLADVSPEKLSLRRRVPAFANSHLEMYNFTLQ